LLDKSRIFLLKKMEKCIFVTTGKAVVSVAGGPAGRISEARSSLRWLSWLFYE
jgi:hypothetical protein